MQALALPAINAKMTERDEALHIHDPVRQKYVRCTPEEWVRQHWIHFLRNARNVPLGLITVEQAFTWQERIHRADLVVHTRSGNPLVLLECKAPSVPLTQDVFDQTSRYNQVLQAPFWVASNGHLHYVCRVDPGAGKAEFLDELPTYDELCAKASST
ncbi:MAG: type I restriction enzyme HsdR N-terminal domain-containing protein [Longimonas sp.]|uniref:type I restriction enzyme HsdR N-terminal domain-containing protein n=1 Tax=Longimonas sp. TaxID=2039626 RepID=UPI003974F48A